jgi:MerR family transcriptional regulator, Zn(II)-responsive regulator of zntA
VIILGHLQRRVELIPRPLTIGFSLAELKTILTVRDKGGAPCHHVRDLLRSKIATDPDPLKFNRYFRLSLSSSYAYFKYA